MRHRTSTAQRPSVLLHLRRTPDKPDPVTALTRLLMTVAVLAAYSGEGAVVPWLYGVEVPVSSQADTERQRASREALSTLLTRLTGMGSIPRTDAVRDALARPESYYTRYQFERRRANAANRGLDDRNEQTVLVIHFEPASVQGLLRRAGLPIWAANRPATLAWVVVQRDGERVILADTPSEMAAALKARARERGLEVFLPVGDLQDMALAPAEVRGRFWGRIADASARYAPDMLLVGRVEQVRDGAWRTVWALRNAPRGTPGALHVEQAEAAPTAAVSASFRRRALSDRAAAEAGVDGAVAALADRFAARGTLSAIDVTVRNAQTVRAYAFLMQHLRSREYVERFELRAVRPEAMDFRLHSRSSPRQLRELLALAGKFSVDAEGPATLNLTWTGEE